MEISELLEQQLNVNDILRYFPDIEADPEAALYLSKAVATDLQSRVQSLKAELEQAYPLSNTPCRPRQAPASLSHVLQAHQDRETALERFIADQERAFEEKEREGLDALIQRKVDLESQASVHGTFRVHRGRTYRLIEHTLSTPSHRAASPLHRTTSPCNNGILRKCCTRAQRMPPRRGSLRYLLPTALLGRSRFLRSLCSSKRNSRFD